MSRNSSTGPSGVAARAVGRVRREERDRLVTPVVDQPRRASLGVEREHRQQFDGGDAEFPEIRDLLDQPGERAAGLLSDPGARVAGEPADVHLVDDGARGGPAQREVALPVVRARIDDHALHRRRGVVALPSRGLAVVVLRDDHAPAVRVEQDLGGIEPQPARGVRRPLDPVAVDLSRRAPGHEHVPVVVGPVRRRVDPDHAGRGGVVLPVEEQEFDARGGPREQAEVDAPLDDGGAQGELRPMLSAEAPGRSFGGSAWRSS